MNDNFKRFGKMMATFCSYFDRKLSEDVMNLYWEALKGYDIEDIEKAAARIIHTSKFFPKVADFIENMGGIQTNDDRAILATHEVLDKMRREGADSSVVFEDDVIMVAIQMRGGWPEICDEVNRYKLEELHFWEKDFAKLYKAIASQQNIGFVPKWLKGRHEISNIENGYHVNGMVLLPAGDSIPITRFYGIPDSRVKQIEGGVDLDELESHDPMVQIAIAKRKKKND